MFEVDFTEIILILGIALVVLGPDKLPRVAAEIGRWVGRARALIGFGLVLQHIEGLDPCPMCILQRYAFEAIGTVALIAAIHDPVGVGVKVYSFLIGALAVAGGSVSVRQSLLQRFPAPEPSNCMAGDLDFLLGNFPLAQALPRIFAGTGDCAKVEWSLFGLSIAEWALAWFILLVATAAWLAVFRKRPTPAVA